MKILSCDDLQSTICSLSNIFDIQEDKLKNNLILIDYYNKFNKAIDDGFEGDFGKFLYAQIKTHFNIAEIQLDRINWFHLTRTINPDSFLKGILPLGVIKQQLFDSLHSLVKSEIPLFDWQQLIIRGPGGFNNDLYLMKMNDPFHHGCYAMLIKEIAFCSNIGNHNYLTVPEIVEDLAVGIQSQYGINFLKRYAENTKSVIVKFYIDASNTERNPECYIETALRYVYHKLNGFELSLCCNTSFDAKNQLIPKENIIEIEIV